MLQVSFWYGGICLQWINHLTGTHCYKFWTKYHEQLTYGFNWWTKSELILDETWRLEMSTLKVSLLRLCGFGQRPGSGCNTAQVASNSYGKPVIFLAQDRLWEECFLALTNVQRALQVKRKSRESLVVGAITVTRFHSPPCHLASRGQLLWLMSVGKVFFQILEIL